MHVPKAIPLTAGHANGISKLHIGFTLLHLVELKSANCMQALDCTHPVVCLFGNNDELDAILVKEPQILLTHVGSRGISSKFARRSKRMDPLFLKHFQLTFFSLSLHHCIDLILGEGVEDGQDLFLLIVPFDMEDISFKHLIEVRRLGQ